jgi:acetoin utilization deacetylase AcuC-like enzyme
MGINIDRLISIYNIPDANVSLLYRIHDRGYVEMIKRECESGFHYIDPDTYATEHTFAISARFATTAYRAAKKSLETREPRMIMPRPEATMLVEGAGPWELQHSASVYSTT